MRLENGEKVIFKVHPHWLYVVFPELLLMFYGFIFLSVASFLPWWISTIFIVALLFAILMVFLDWLSINYYLTDRRLIEERGIIGKRIMFIPLSKVQDVTCKFGVFGRIFDFGDLEIESAGTYGKITFNFIADPRKRKEEISEAISRIEGNKSNMEKEKGK